MTIHLPILSKKTEGLAALRQQRVEKYVSE